VPALSAIKATCGRRNGGIHGIGVDILETAPGWCLRERKIELGAKEKT
jgi:hypothetical protein